MSKISDAAIALIIAEEITDRATYAKRYRHFEWPGGASGPTVGIGYDCGHVTRQELADDWAGIAPKATIGAMLEAVGITGPAARDWVRAHGGSVTIEYDQAERQFRERELPKWIARVRASLPRFDELPPDCAGALVSLAYNRGCSWDLQGDRYAEMRAIKVYMAAGEFSEIPAEIRSMARLWTNGVAERRMREAQLFLNGLNADPVMTRAPATVVTLPIREQVSSGEITMPPPLPPQRDADPEPTTPDVLEAIFDRIGSRGLAALGSRSAGCIRWLKRLLGLGATGTAGVGLMGGEIQNELSPLVVCLVVAGIFAFGAAAAYAAEHYLVAAARDGRYRPRDAA